MAAAVPLIRSLPDCTDFSKVVQPYLPQLYALPQQFLHSATNLDDLKQLYVSTNPLIFAFAFSLALAPIFLVLSEINKNYSQVDRCWSILPTIYNIHYDVWAHMNGLPAYRLDNVVAFSTLWSLRLTFNYWRKGGYKIGVEDYRWEIIRGKVHPALFFIFNVTFIATIQSVLLFTITTPTYLLLLASRATATNTLTPSDTVFVRTLMSLILLTFFADQQQWDYQNAKASYRQTARPTQRFSAAQLERGFVTSGLWRWSRHPNFAAEQAIWVGLYQWGCWATETYWNWTGVGALGYLILFQGSTWFTEIVSKGKYEEYAEYQRRVGRFLPKVALTGFEGWDEDEVKEERKGKGKKKE
ncbi:MAG: hypothetical protein Q9157_003066 [Trypethelium eluteriae]